jgi:hypothetical protein
MTAATAEPKTITILHCKLSKDGKMQMSLRGREAKVLKAASELCEFLLSARALENAASVARDAIQALRKELGDNE